jgi:hypothetical protein
MAGSDVCFMTCLASISPTEEVDEQLRELKTGLDTPPVIADDMGVWSIG